MLNHKHITITTGIIAATGSILVALIAYIEHKRHSAIKADILRLDQQLKSLQIEKAKTELGKE